VVINAPIDEVFEFFTGTLKSRDQTKPADLTLEGPTHSRAQLVLGRKIEVKYSFYAVPGGTQIVAAIEHLSGQIADPRGILARRVAKRRVDLELSRVKNRLE
jgi:hypothetical protein